MVLFLSSWKTHSNMIDTQASFELTAPRQDSCVTSERNATRTPYWEWIRATPSHRRTLFSEPISPRSSSSSLTDEEDDTEDDYAFYYAHPERLVYHTHSAAQTARRKSIRAQSDFSRRQSLARERDSLLTMVDEYAADVMVLHNEDRISLCDSQGSFESDETVLTSSEEESDYDASPWGTPSPQKVRSPKYKQNDKVKLLLVESRTPVTPSSQSRKLAKRKNKSCDDAVAILHKSAEHETSYPHVRRTRSRLSIFRIFSERL